MNKQDKIFETIIQSIDLKNGTICFRGQYADETKDLDVSVLVPFIERDIFIAQKNKQIAKTPVEVKASKNKSSHIIIIFNDESNNGFKLLKTYLIQILWNYNYFSYDAKTDKHQQRFTYSILSTTPENQTQVAA